jgi:hypothetical protein
MLYLLSDFALHMKHSPADRYMALTIIPTIRPNEAPMAMDGTKMPAGTLHPVLTMTSATLMMVASSSELTIRHCTDVL